MKDDEIEAKARELCAAWSTGGNVERIAAALRTARNEAYANGYSTAIETAAQVADNEEEPDPSEAPDLIGTDPVVLVIGSVRATKKSVARRIRSLSSHPAGGHDG